MAQIINIENADIGFRNFEGREGDYNKPGDRSFAVFLDHGMAEELANLGWNVKFPKEVERIDPDQDSRRPYLNVGIGFEQFPASVFLISNGKPTRLYEDQVAMLDWAELSNIDLVIRPYEWTMRGKTGIKAYLKSGYFTIVTDQFAEKYGL